MTTALAKVPVCQPTVPSLLVICRFPSSKSLSESACGLPLKLVGPVLLDCQTVEPDEDTTRRSPPVNCAVSVVLEVWVLQMAVLFLYSTRLPSACMTTVKVVPLAAVALQRAWRSGRCGSRLVGRRRHHPHGGGHYRHHQPNHSGPPRRPAAPGLCSPHARLRPRWGSLRSAATLILGG